MELLKDYGDPNANRVTSFVLMIDSIIEGESWISVEPGLLVPHTLHQWDTGGC